MLAREGKEAVGGLCPCAAGSAQRLRSQQGSEQPQGTCGWGITRCCCLLAPHWFCSGLGCEERDAELVAALSSSVPCHEHSLGNWNSVIGKMERVWTRDTGQVGCEHAWRAGEGKSLLPACWAPA